MIQFKPKAGGLLKIFDGAESMPRINEYKFNVHLALEYGIGSDLNGVSKRYNKIALLISKEKNAEALQELENLMITHQSMIEGLDHQSRAFASLVYSVNGNVNEDLSDEGLDSLIESFHQIETGEIESVIKMVKKNLKMS